MTDLVAAEIQAEDPRAMAERWGLALGQPVVDGARIRLSDATIRFTQAEDGRGDGLAAVDVVAADQGRVGECVELCGVQFNLV